MNERRPVPRPVGVSSYEVVMRAQAEERRRSLNAVNWSMRLMAVATMAVACVPRIGAIVWFVGGPVCLIILVLAVIAITKGGLVSGLTGILVALVILPLWCLAAPIGVMQIMQMRDAGANREMEWQQRPKARNSL